MTPARNINSPKQILPGEICKSSVVGRLIDRLSDAVRTGSRCHKSTRRVGTCVTRVTVYPGREDTPRSAFAKVPARRNVSGEGRGNPGVAGWFSNKESRAEGNYAVRVHPPWESFGISNISNRARRTVAP